MESKQRQGRCIFCDGFGLTKHHVVPDWMSPYLGEVETVRQSKSITYLGVSSGTDEVVLVPEMPVLKNYGTLFGQLQYRVVCRTCNGGWISQIEQASIPLLSPMLAGERFEVPPDKVKLLSVALAFIAIMHEFSDDAGKRIVTKEQLNYIMRSRCLPSGWYVAIGIMEDGAGERAKSKYAFVKGVGSFSISNFALGRLLVQVVICDNFIYPVAFQKTVFRQVWPRTIIENGWRDKVREISKLEFDSVADCMFGPMTLAFNSYVKGLL